MTFAFLERTFEEPATTGQFLDMARRSAGCFDLHDVEWQYSLLSSDGHHLVCWFRAHDMESVRIALRTDNTDLRVFWPGSVHDAPGMSEIGPGSANVIVKRQFDAPVRLEDIQAIEDAGAGCLEMRDVTFVRTFFASDRKRMLCLYRAPDAESVRQAQREAGMPFDEIWACRGIGPDSVLTSI